MSGIKEKLFGSGKVSPAPLATEKPGIDVTSGSKSDGKKPEVVTTKKTKAHRKLYTGAADLQKQKEEKWSKFRRFFYSMFKSDKEEKQDKGVAGKVGPSNSETWLTLAFTVIVGCFLLGGGMYLIYNGSEYYVIDFVVLGSVGIAMGICFSAVGLYTVCKPAWDERREREERRRAEGRDNPQSTDQTPAYFSPAQAHIMTVQISAHNSQRRPSHVELYGADQNHYSPRDSFPPPPPVAVPNHEKETREVKAVILLGERQATADDIHAIARAAEVNNLTSAIPPPELELETLGESGHDQESVTDVSEKSHCSPEIELKTDSSSDRDSIVDVIERSDANTGRTQTPLDKGVPDPDTPALDPDARHDSPVQVVVTPRHTTQGDSEVGT